MATNTFKFGNGNWAVKDGSVLAYNDENNNFKPLPFDFTRDSIATRVNSEGLIEVVLNNIPRIDFTDNTDGHLLLEPSRKNDLTYSEFTNADPVGWTLGFGTGTYDYDLVSYRGRGALKQTQTTTGRSYQYQNVTLLASTTYTLSMYVDISNSDVTNLGEDIMHVIADDETGDNTVEWQDIDTNTGRVSITFTTGSDTSVQIRIGLGVTGNTLASNQVLIYSMPQLEAGSYATSYIPTEGASVPRAVEYANDAGNSQVFNNDTGVWFIDLERIGLESGRAMMLANASGSEQIRIHFDTTAQIRFRDAKASFATIGSNISMDLGTRKKVALKIDGTTLKVFAGGSQIGSNYTRPTAFDIHSMYAAEDAFKLFDARFYNTALTDTELQKLTS